MPTIMPGPLLEAGDIKARKTDVDTAPVMNRPYGSDR